MKIILLSLLSILFFTVNTFALDTSTETGKTQRQDFERSKSLKKSKEEKESRGKRKSDTITTGIDKQTQETIKAIGQAMSQSEADIVLSLETIFIDKIAEFESTNTSENTKLFKTCKIITQPKLAKDFGLTAEVRSGVIDVIKADYLSKAAMSNSYIKNITNEQALKDYRNCLTAYGAIIAQAFINLTEDLADLKIAVSKDRDGNISVNGLGYDDFILLANAALDKAIQTDITNQTIKRISERALNDNNFCQFDRSVENIKCGSSLIILGTKPQLYISGIHWFGERFGGYQGSYKVSKAWSYQDAIEKMKTTSKYSKFASEVSRFAEDLESQGKTKEAMLVRKKAFELMKSNKQAVSPAKLLPGL